jgi:hypothetical protein
MEARVVKVDGKKITYEITIEHEGSMLQMEDKIQEAVNALGKRATEDTLTNFDTNGSPIELSGVKYTSKGQSKKKLKPRTEQ